MSDLYDEDILLWSERQSTLLRCIAAGEPVNERPDWANIIEEIESVGREQLHAVESLLRQALLYMLKAEAWPRFRVDSVSRFAPSVRQRLDLAKLYREALRIMPETIDGRRRCPCRRPAPSRWMSC